jgi:50S ribosomal subunit-associated GTPase HflX
MMEQKLTVDAILEELGLSGKPVAEVYNKVDLLPWGAERAFAHGSDSTPRLAVSARTGYGLDRLRDLLRDVLVSMDGRASDPAPAPRLTVGG